MWIAKVVLGFRHVRLTAVSYVFWFVRKPCHRHSQSAALLVAYLLHPTDWLVGGCREEGSRGEKENSYTCAGVAMAPDVAVALMLISAAAPNAAVKLS